MPDLFDSMPDADDRPWRAEWIKLPIGKLINVTSRSARLVQGAVHYYRRAYLCPGADLCPACESQRSRSMCWMFCGRPNSVNVLELNMLSWLRCYDKMLNDGQLSPLEVMDVQFSALRPSVKKTVILERVKQTSLSFTCDQITEVRQLEVLARLFGLGMTAKSSTRLELDATLKHHAAAALRAAIAEAERLNQH